jgi:hypothetical protein
LVHLRDLGIGDHDPAGASARNVQSALVVRIRIQGGDVLHFQHAAQALDRGGGETEAGTQRERVRVPQAGLLRVLVAHARIQRHLSLGERLAHSRIGGLGGCASEGKQGASQNRDEVTTRGIHGK